MNFLCAPFGNTCPHHTALHVSLTRTHVRLRTGPFVGRWKRATRKLPHTRGQTQAEQYRNRWIRRVRERKGRGRGRVCVEGREGGRGHTPWVQKALTDSAPRPRRACERRGAVSEGEQGARVLRQRGEGE
eukprot:1202529-Rhodomonas_salina.1